ncbi:zinc finger protein ZAT11 [Ziziphus jujuba]|uniref:Zinc finger protein ZAT11 n=2 Tax=Ziziphus jujuba TaxID=326968 RepID=A0A6P4AN26_ZIZJJ|nr:zinc finger protein ZAT11 [Ziziphus jujuba]KAH7512979.1 hypothetical protein FEM48_Zijuj12G0147800 [Ziziphus jujuba var. spinosa]
MKRTREEEGGIQQQSLDLAQCLIMLSHGLQTKPTKQFTAGPAEIFECKTCNRRFPSFQALGGHRASHKKPRLVGEEPKNETKFGNRISVDKPKMHECSICGLEFAMGQALGGHMRRHRTVAMDMAEFSSVVPVVSKAPVVLKRSNSVKVLWMDLNLTPLENDLKLLFGKMAPKVDAFVS